MINVRMILFQQLRNLLYATVVTSWQHLPHFFPLLGMTLVLVVLFLGGALLLTNKKNRYLLLSHYYMVIAGFVILVDVLARVGVSYSSAIVGFATFFSIASLFGFWKKRDTITSWLKNNKTEKPKWILLFFVTLVSTFFFSKFIYGNGLHDEYQHHAAVEDMLQKQHWPIRDELRYGVDLSDYYHYGWYYLVILVKLVFPVSIEVALDLVKLMLFLPIIPLFYGLIEKYLHTKWYESLLLAVTLLVQGPALFFLDAYSGNVFFSQGNEIIYEPLFFQLAGVTWFGVILLVALVAIAHFMLQQKNNILSLVVFFVFSIWSFFLLNKASFLVFVPTVLVLSIYAFRKRLTPLLQNKKFVLFSLLVLLLAVFGFLILDTYFSSILFFSLFKGEGTIPFIRSISKWGIPYSSQTGLAYQSIISLGSIRAFGLVPILSSIILITGVYKRKLTSVLQIILFGFLWMTPLFLNFSGSDLVLNKFYIPAMWMSTGIFVQFLFKQSNRIKYIASLLLLTAAIAPTMYFASISIPGSNIYWNYSDEIITYLSEQHAEYVVIDDAEYGKYLINQLDVQLIPSRILDVPDSVEYQITTEGYPDEEPLAQTDTHYLYSK